MHFGALTKSYDSQHFPFYFPQITCSCGARTLSHVCESKAQQGSGSRPDYYDGLAPRRSQKATRGTRESGEPIVVELYFDVFPATDGRVRFATTSVSQIRTIAFGSTPNVRQYLRKRVGTRIETFDFCILNFGAHLPIGAMPVPSQNWHRKSRSPVVARNPHQYLLAAPCRRNVEART
jgi:hypothetical protein